MRVAVDPIAMVEAREEPVPTPAADAADASAPRQAASEERLSIRDDEALRAAAFDSLPAAELLLDANDTLVLATDLARRMFGLSAGDFGRPIQQLELFSCPVPLNAYFELPTGERKPVEMKGAQWNRRDGQHLLDVRIAPLSRGQQTPGTNISYRDATKQRLLQRRLADTRRDLAQACEELQPALEQLEINLQALRSLDKQLDISHQELLIAHAQLEWTADQLESSRQELGLLKDELDRQHRELRWRKALLAAVPATLALQAIAAEGRAGNLHQHSLPGAADAARRQPQPIIPGLALPSPRTQHRPRAA